MPEYDYFRVMSAESVYAYIGFGASSATMSLSDMPHLQYSVNNTVDWHDFTWAQSGEYFYTTNYPEASRIGAVFIRGIGNTAFTKNYAGNNSSIIGLMAYDSDDNITSVNVLGRISSLLDYETMGEKTVSTTGCFAHLFGASPKVVDVIDASGLILDVMGPSCYVGLFGGTSTSAQTNLVKMPQFPITTLADRCYYAMFNYCSKIKISTMKKGDYRDEFIIPTTGTGTVGTDSLLDMFSSTGGIFTGTPTINTTYYLYAEPFYIEAVESTTITLSKQSTPTTGNCYYGINDESYPSIYSYGNPISLTAGQRCYFYISTSATAFTTSKYLYFTSTGKIKCGGRMTSLIGNKDSIPRNYCFVYLFSQCGSRLIDASKLCLPSTFNNKTYCFYGMFQNCSALTAPPELPTMLLTSSCYNNMFGGCTSLTTPPVLPATIMANSCYYNMFVACTSLTSLPDLPATSLASLCYGSMFYECTSIKVSETQTGNYRTPYRIPPTGTATEVSGATRTMFGYTGGTFTGAPAVNTTYYLWSNGEEVSCDIFPDGVGTVTGTGAYAEGEEVTLTATPNSMYNFFAWDLDGTIVSTDNPYTFTMGTEPLAFTAHFIEKPQVTCTINPANYGVVSGTGYYSTGDNVILTATAGTNKVFVDWVIDGVHRTDNPYSFLMPTDSINVTANFRSTIHTVDITPYPQVYGTVTGSGIYNEGTSVTATATPARHKVFYCFGTIVNENYLPMTLPETFGEQAVPISTNNPYTFTVGIEDRTFHAIFRDLAWIDCITDRTQADVNKVKLLNGKLRNGTITQEELAEWALNLKGALNRSDLERIEHNLTIIADKLNYSYDPNIPALPLRNYFEALKTTINILRNKYMVYATTPATPDLPYNHYTKWNDIEKIIEDLYNILKTRGKNYCGEIYCDDIGLI